MPTSAIAPTGSHRVHHLPGQHDGRARALQCDLQQSPRLQPVRRVAHRSVRQTRDRRYGYRQECRAVRPISLTGKACRADAAGWYRPRTGQQGFELPVKVCRAPQWHPGPDGLQALQGRLLIVGDKLQKTDRIGSTCDQAVTELCRNARKGNFDCRWRNAGNDRLKRDSRMPGRDTTTRNRFLSVGNIHSDSPTWLSIDTRYGFILHDTLR